MLSPFKNNKIKKCRNLLLISVQNRNFSLDAKDWDISKAIGHTWKPYEVPVTAKDMILYSLSIGFQ